MLKFSRKLDYAILAVAHLTKIKEPVSARCLAERTSIPPGVLANILKELHHSGVVGSTRGANGGYQLVVAPEDFSVGALARALEGQTRIVECVILPGEDPKATCSCPIEAHCNVKDALRRVHDRIHEVLDELHFDELTGETVSRGSTGPLGR